MSAGAHDLPAWRGGWLNRLVAKPGFQSWASKFPLTRSRARADGAALFDVVQGFVQSQVLMALVELDLFRRMRAGPQSAEVLGRACDVPADRMQVLLQAGGGLGLLERRGGRVGLARQGAALVGGAGGEGVSRDHKAVFDDLRGPVGLLRKTGGTRLRQV
ncbi:MAG: methyltransferase dimerization domain-containing protein, partial [Tateyamaria sp.]